MTTPATMPACYSAVEGAQPSIIATVELHHSPGHDRSIRAMFDCSGVWVTPRALLRCSLGSDCPVLSDTIVYRASFAAILYAEKLDLDSVLPLDAADLPSLPTAKTVDARNAAGGDAVAFATCAVNDATSPQLKRSQDCLTSSSAKEKAACLTVETRDDKLRSVLSCLNGRDASLTLIMECAQDAGSKARLADAQRCAGGARSTAETAKCLLPGIPGPQQAVAACVADSGRSTDVAACLDNVSPDFARARKVVGCIEGRRDSAASAASCVADVVPGEAGRVAGCLGSPDSETRHSAFFTVTSRAKRLADCIVASRRAKMRRR